MNKIQLRDQTPLSGGTDLSRNFIFLRIALIKKTIKRFSRNLPILIPLLTLILSGCGISKIADRMEAQKELLREMNKKETALGIFSQINPDEVPPEEKKPEFPPAGNTYTNIFDMLDYEEVSFSVIKESKILVTNSDPETLTPKAGKEQPKITPLRNTYKPAGATIPAGTEQFRLIYDPETDRVTEFEIK